MLSYEGYEQKNFLLQDYGQLTLSCL